MKFATTVLVVCSLAAPALADWATFREVYSAPAQPADGSIGATITAMDTFMAELRAVDMSSEVEELRVFKSDALAILAERRTAIQHYGEVLAMRQAFEAQVKAYHEQNEQMTLSGDQACEAKDGNTAPDSYCKQNVDTDAEQYRDLIRSWIEDNLPSVENASQSVADELQRSSEMMEALNAAYQRLLAEHP